jgi:hypothetical protein
MAQAICESTTFNMQKRSNRPPDASLLALCAEAAAIEAKIDAIGRPSWPGRWPQRSRWWRGLPLARCPNSSRARE